MKLLRKAMPAALVLFCLYCGTGLASQVVLEATEVLRVVSPAQSGDVRYLCRFSIPDSLSSKEIVWARLVLSTHSADIVSLVTARLGGSWSALSSWESLASGLALDDAFNGEVGGDAQISGNDTAEVGGQVVDLGFEFSAGKWVRDWIGANPNHGLCIRRVAGDSTDMSTVLTQGLPLPTLRIVFVE